MHNFKAEIQKLATAEDEYPVYDGIINPRKYAKSPLKILWILKDLPNLEEKGSFNLKEKIAKINTDDGIRQDFKNTFKKIAEVSATILNRFDASFDKKTSSENNFKSLEHIAVMSIKKVFDGKKASNAEIQELYQQSKKLLFNQIETFEPDVFIFVNTYTYFQNDFNLNLLNSFGSCKATAKADKIYMSVKNPATHMDDPTYVSDCLQAYLVFRKQIDHRKTQAYSKADYNNDLEELQHFFKQSKIKINQIEERLLKSQKYEQLAQMKDLRKGMEIILDEMDGFKKRV